MKEKDKRKRGAGDAWAFPRHFYYEVDASLEYVVKEMASLDWRGSIFSTGVDIELKPNSDESDYTFHIRSQKFDGTPTGATAEGRIYNVTRQTVAIKGTVLVDSRQFTWLLVSIAFLALVIVGVFTFVWSASLIGVVLSLPLLSFVLMRAIKLQEKRDQVHDQIHYALYIVTQSKAPYQKPPRPARSPFRRRPATMQRREESDDNERRQA